MSSPNGVSVTWIPFTLTALSIDSISVVKVSILFLRALESVSFDCMNFFKSLISFFNRAPRPTFNPESERVRVDERVYSPSRETKVLYASLISLLS